MLATICIPNLDSVVGCDNVELLSGIFFFFFEAVEQPRLTGVSALSDLFRRVRLVRNRAPPLKGFGQLA